MLRQDSILKPSRQTFHAQTTKEVDINVLVQTDLLFFILKNSKTFYQVTQLGTQSQLYSNYDRKEIVMTCRFSLFGQPIQFRVGKLYFYVREPWSSRYGRSLMFQRLWVQIPAPYTKWQVLRIAKTFCKAFYGCYQMACIMLITLVLLLAHRCSGNHVGNFFWSINTSGIWSSCLQPIRIENDV